MIQQLRTREILDCEKERRLRLLQRLLPAQQLTDRPRQRSSVAHSTVFRWEEALSEVEV